LLAGGGEGLAEIKQRGLAFAAEADGFEVFFGGEDGRWDFDDIPSAGDGAAVGVDHLGFLQPLRSWVVSRLILLHHIHLQEMRGEADHWLVVDSGPRKDASCLGVVD
jgi:hypothetical protein